MNIKTNFKNKQFGNIFFTDDIVEVLNLSQGQIYDIRSQTCDFNKHPGKDIVGMRYKLKVRIYDEKEIWHMLLGWNHGGHVSDKFNPEQLRLIHRPFKNWWKLIKLKVVGQYYP